jgi:NADH-quinone oxidoreductase subunit N
MSDWVRFLPEMVMLGGAGLMLALCWLRPAQGRDDWVAAAVGVAAVGACLAVLDARGDMFAGTYRVDFFAQLFKLLLAGGFLLIVGLGRGRPGIRPALYSEYYLLLMVCTLAMMLLVSSVHLLVIYVALELSSYSLYILVSLRTEREGAAAAALKYFLVGATASAVMLFGLALIYGVSGTAYLSEILPRLPALTAQPAFGVGLFLALGGFFFKLALFPFHFWAPAAYAGAAHPVAAYIATVSKVAAVGLLIRLSLLGSGTALTQVLVVLAVVSMTLGNLAAIAQTDLKRLLAYSSVAHGGYVLLGILCLGADGYAGAMFYILAVVLMKASCFLVVIAAAPDGRNIQVDELAGLHRQAPLLAMVLMVALFGLAGIPPTIGFTGKLLLFTAVVQKGYLALALIAMANVVVSLYYYLRVLRAAYLLEPAAGAAPPPPTLLSQTLALLLTAAMVAIGFYPQPVLALVRQAAALVS